MADLLSRKSYRQVVANLKHYQQQHAEDRRESSSSIPPAWGTPLRMMIERVVRENRERVYPGLADKVLEHLVGQKLLIRYLGDYTFPSDEKLPTREEVVDRTKKFLDGLGT